MPACKLDSRTGFLIERPGAHNCNCCVSGKQFFPNQLCEGQGHTAVAEGIAGAQESLAAHLTPSPSPIRLERVARAEAITLRIPQLKDCKNHFDKKKEKGKGTMVFICEGQSAVVNYVITPLVRVRVLEKPVLARCPRQLRWQFRNANVASESSADTSRDSTRTSRERPR